MRGCKAGCLLDILHVGWGILEQFWNLLKKLGNWKGTGKNRGPILNKRKGKERFPFFAWRIGKDRIPEKMDRLTCMAYD